MHALTEWTPRVVPRINRLSSAVNNVLEGEMRSNQNGIYSGPDILPLAWRVPEGELDVHMIAIANANSRRRLLANDASVDGAIGDGNAERRLASNATSEHRKLVIVKGSGWRLESTPIGFCDGSAQSICNRSRKTSAC